MVPAHVFPDQLCLENKMSPPSSSFHLDLFGAAKSQEMALWGRPQSVARTCHVSGSHASPWELTHIHWHSAHQFREGLFISASRDCHWVGEHPCHPPICLPDPGAFTQEVGSTLVWQDSLPVAGVIRPGKRGEGMGVY